MWLKPRTPGLQVKHFTIATQVPPPTTYLLRHAELDSCNLTLSQTTNFRLFQIESVCRRQFQIGWKWQNVFQPARKHCGKRRNCSLRAISPFPTVFSKDLYCRHVKTRACLGKGWMFTSYGYYRLVQFSSKQKYDVKNMDKWKNTVNWLSTKHCAKRRNCWLWAISSFPGMFSKAVKWL